MSADTPTPRSTPSNPERPRQIGALLVILGGLALLAQFGLFGGLDDFVFALLFAAGGAWLIRRYRTQGSAWSLPVGFALLGLAAAAITPDAIGGMSFLALLGVGFVALQWDDRTRWWALIPGGILITLGVVAGIDETVPRFDPGPVLFLGLAVTFYALTRLRETPQRWAIYPALGALAVGILSLSFTGGWLFPLLLVAAGVWLLSRGGNLGGVGEAITREGERLFGRPSAEPTPDASAESSIATASTPTSATSTSPQADPAHDGDVDVRTDPATPHASTPQHRAEPGGRDAPADPEASDDAGEDERRDA